MIKVVLTTCMLVLAQADQQGVPPMRPIPPLEPFEPFEPTGLNCEMKYVYVDGEWRWLQICEEDT